MRPVGRGDVIDDDLLGAAESGPLAKVGRHSQERQYPAMRVPRLPTDVRGGNPLSETLEDVWLRRPDAPRRRRGWSRGRLRITPASVRWRAGDPFRRPVDLVKAEFVRQRSMELAIDWPLPSPMRVLVFRAGGQALELGVWPTGSVRPHVSPLRRRLTDAPDQPAAARRVLSADQGRCWPGGSQDRQPLWSMNERTSFFGACGAG